MAANPPSTWPKITTTKPEKKEFSSTQHYRYRERMYDPPVKVNLLQEAPQSYSGPEAVLIAQISAMRRLDFDWWFNTWDEVSKKKIVERGQGTDKSKDVWLKKWKEEFSTAEAVLLRWIETREYVIVTYQLPSISSSKQKEIPAAFKLANGRWSATLDLENDPVLLYFGEGKARIERVVR